MQQCCSRTLLALFSVLPLLIVTSASALPFGFYNITKNNSTDARIGEAQLFVEVTKGPGSNQALFTFFNIGPAASSITKIYFDDSTLLKDIAAITNSLGVKFSRPATPKNLPGGKNATPPFEVTPGFSVGSDSPVQPNGVNPGETLGLLLRLQNGKTWDDVIMQLQGGSLHIGIHVQGFASGGSESFVNTPTPVPEPGTLLLVSTGLVSLLGLRWRRKKYYA